MNYTGMLEKASEIQGFMIDVRNIPFNVYLKDTGDILHLCFMEYEDDDWVMVSETVSNGTEEIRIIPKSNIEFIGIFYDFKSLEPRKQDKMII